MTTFLFAFTALFTIVNPLPGAFIFLGATQDLGARVRAQLSLWVAIYAFSIIAASLYVGGYVLLFFGISLPVLKIAGGLIVANTAWGMVTSSSRMTASESDEAATKDDISLTPMAMPILSGPGSIGVVMGLAAHSDHLMSYLGMVVGIVAVSLTCYLFLRLGGPLAARLGPGTIGAINRIFGFLILAIAVQLVWDGMADFRT